MSGFLPVHPFLFSTRFPCPITMSSFLEKQSVVLLYTTTTISPHPNLPHEYLQEISLHFQIHETTSPHLQTTLGLVPFTSISHTMIKQIINTETDSSPMLLQTQAPPDHHIYSSSMENKRRKKIKMVVSHQEEGEGKRKKQSKKNGSKTEGMMRKLNTSSEAKKKQNQGVAAADADQIQEAPTGFVRVRARRGQATDSHSLAERARREKISMRMKLLQSIVPGCDKINGKAHILDEIINYVQSLQNQVECLAAKLASVDIMLSREFIKLDPLITNTLSDDQRQCCLEPPLCSLPESSSTQFRSFADNAPTSVSLVLSEEYQRPTVHSQDDGNLFFGLDDQSEDIISQCGLDNLCTF